MTKKVLILCQRKSGPIYVGQNSKGEEKYDNVESRIAPKINKLVKDLIPTDYELEYLSTLEGQHSKGEVDIQGLLSLDEYQNGILTLKNKSNEKISTRDFIKQNKGSYALIILNTCPFAYMDYNIIYDLLAAEGLMAFTAYPREVAKLPFEPPKKLFVVDALNTKVALYKKNQSPVKTASPVKTTSSSTKKRNRKTSADATPPYKVGGQRKKRTYAKRTKRNKKY